VIHCKTFKLRELRSLSGYGNDWQLDRHTGFPKHFLSGHRMAAHASLRKEITSAMPLAVFQTHSVGIVSAAKQNSETLKGHPLRLLRVLLRLADLPNHR
jgi:hypothetical protein